MRRHILPFSLPSSRLHTLRSLITANPAQVYNMFHRVNMHEMLMTSATGPGEGEPAKLVLNHAYESVDHETGTITFKNGVTAQHDLIVGADGIGVGVSAYHIVPT